ncbi:hypothetical protein MXD63_33020 [Frankia sp. Cpl3]|nr:hypothetical protein [Frankia sp. Cpl3]
MPPRVETPGSPRGLTSAVPGGSRMATINDGTTSSAGHTAATAARTAQRVALAPGAATAAAARTDQRSVRQTAPQRCAATDSDPYIRGTAATGAVAAVDARGPAIGPAGVPPTGCHATIGATEPAHGALPAGRSVVLSARPGRRRAVSTPAGDIDLQDLT